MAVHFWEQGRLLTPHVMELVYRGAPKRGIRIRQPEGYDEALAILQWEDWARSDQEDTLELIGQATCIPRPGGRRPRPPKKESAASRREMTASLGGSWR